jgi:hypothetical protein
VSSWRIDNLNDRQSVAYLITFAVVLHTKLQQVFKLFSEEEVVTLRIAVLSIETS